MVGMPSQVKSSVSKKHRFKKPAAGFHFRHLLAVVIEQKGILVLPPDGVNVELFRQLGNRLPLKNPPARRAAFPVISNAGPLTFRDLRFGEIPVDPDLLGDVVLARKDIGTAYHLAVVVDDAFQEITHVTRGEDLLSSTHVHCLLQVLLGFPAPLYLHHLLMLDEAGKRLAKRNDSLSVAALRDRGLSAVEVLAMTDETLRSYPTPPADSPPAT